MRSGFWAYYLLLVRSEATLREERQLAAKRAGRPIGQSQGEYSHSMWKYASLGHMNSEGNFNLDFPLSFKRDIC